MTHQRKPTKWKPRPKYQARGPRKSLTRLILMRLGDRRVMQVTMLQQITGDTWANLLTAMSRMERMEVLIVEREKYTGKALRCWLTEKGVWYAAEMRRLGFREDGGW